MRLRVILCSAPSPANKGKVRANPLLIAFTINGTQIMSYVIFILWYYRLIMKKKKCYLNYKVSLLTRKLDTTQPLLLRKTYMLPPFLGYGFIC